MEEKKNSPLVLLIVLLIAVVIVSSLVVMAISDKVTTKKLAIIEKEYLLRLDGLKSDAQEIQELRQLILEIAKKPVNFTEIKLLEDFARLRRLMSRLEDKVDNYKPSTTIIYTPTPPY